MASPLRTLAELHGTTLAAAGLSAIGWLGLAALLYGSDQTGPICSVARATALGQTLHPSLFVAWGLMVLAMMGPLLGGAAASPVAPQPGAPSTAKHRALSLDLHHRLVPGVRPVHSGSREHRRIFAQHTPATRADNPDCGRVAVLCAKTRRTAPLPPAPAVGGLRSPGLARSKLVCAPPRILVRAIVLGTHARGVCGTELAANADRNCDHHL